MTKKLTPEESEEWRLVFVRKVSQETRLTASHYPIIGVRQHQLLQAWYHHQVGNDSLHKWTINLRFFPCLVLPIISTITQTFRVLSSCWSLYWPPWKRVQIPTYLPAEQLGLTHKHLLPDNSSARWSPNHQPVPHSSRIFCCPSTNCKQHQGITADMQGIYH